MRPATPLRRQTLASTISNGTSYDSNGTSYDEKLAEVKRSIQIELICGGAAFGCRLCTYDAPPQRLAADMMDGQSSYQSSAKERRGDVFAMCNGFSKV